MLSMVFAQVGLLVEGIGLILGVVKLLDMIRTAVNVSDDAVVSLVLQKVKENLMSLYLMIQMQEPLHKKILR